MSRRPTTDSAVADGWLITFVVEDERVTMTAAPHPHGRRTTDNDYHRLGLMLADALKATGGKSVPVHLTKYDSTDAPQRFAWDTPAAVRH